MDTNYVKNTLTEVKFHLCDINKEIVDEWKLYFEGFENFKVYNCDILEIPISKDNINAIVSPANSFGDLQGGIDLIYYKYFGYNLEERLQEIIIKEKFGELIVGDAIILQM